MLSILIHANIFLIQFTLSNRLTSILISRFLLNLQAVDQKSTRMVSSTSSGVGSIMFERVIGSLGGSTEFGDFCDVGVSEVNGEAVRDGRLEDLEKSLVHRRIEERSAG